MKEGCRSTSFKLSDFNHVCVPSLCNERPLYRWGCHWFCENTLHSLTRCWCKVCHSGRQRRVAHICHAIESRFSNRFKVWVYCISGAPTTFVREPQMDLKVQLVSPRFKSRSVELIVGIGASAILLLSSLPRIAKGPVPAILAATATVSGAYYGNTFYALRRH